MVYRVMIVLTHAGLTLAGLPFVLAICLNSAGLTLAGLLSVLAIC